MTAPKLWLEHADQVLYAHAPREEWLMARQLGLGSSDLVLLMGHGYADASEADLLAEKTGRVKVDAPSARMRRGNHMESYIGEELAGRLGRPSPFRPGLWRSKAHPLSLTTPDFAWSDGVGGETKNVDHYPSAKKYREPDYIAPRFYWQMVDAMAVTGAPKWYLGIDSPYYDEIEVRCLLRSDVADDIDLCLHTKEQWWQAHVVLGLPVETEPVAQDLEELLDDAVESTVPWLLAEDLARWEELAYAGSKAGKEELKAIQQRVGEQLGSHKVLKLNGKPVAAWTERKNPGRLKEAAFKADHPDIDLAQYKGKGSVSRYPRLIRSTQPEGPA